MPQRRNREKPNPNADNSTKKFRLSFPKVGVPLGGLPFVKTKISNITSDQLGDYIARYSAWREYCEDCHITAVAEFAIAKSAYDDAVGKEMILITDADDVTTKKAMAQQKPSVQKLSKELLEKEVYFKMIANKLESFSNTLTVLSRELTRRGITNI